MTDSWQETDWHYRDSAAGSNASPKHAGLVAWGASFDGATSQSNFVIGDAGDIVCTELDGLATYLEVGLLAWRAGELC